MNSVLFSDLNIGSLCLPNRIIMAPMTRGRANPDGTPSEPMIRYYADRAAAGLLISEGVCVSQGGKGWAGAPSIYTAEHEAGWRKITDAVHERGGRIFAQLWYLGRVSHPVFLGGAKPWAPSPIAANGHVYAPDGSRHNHVTPHAMDSGDIRVVVKEFAAASRMAIAAGFDGVQIHAANGYLPDQFLRDQTNRRTDEYGGSAANRSRFLVEIADACSEAIGSEQVSVRLSTRNRYNDIDDSDPASTFGTLCELLRPMGLSFIEIVEALPGHFLFVDGEPLIGELRRLFGGPLIVNGGYDRESAECVIKRGDADAVSFGIPFLANPDLVYRMQIDAPLNPADPETFYSAGEPGYLTYPTLDEAAPVAGGDKKFTIEEASRH